MKDIKMGENNFNIKKFNFIVNLLSVILYTITTLIWVAGTENKIIKILAFTVLIIYILLFSIISIFSNDTSNKKMQKYKKYMKKLKSFLKFINLIIVIISAISLFSFSLKNIFSLLLNILLLSIQITSFLIRFYIYLFKRRIKKAFAFYSNNKNKKPSLFDFIKKDISEDDDDDENMINDENRIIIDDNL